MATLLLIIIYIAFIGLGIPDSLFGAAWPKIYEELALPMSFGSFVSLIASLGTVISSMASSWLVSKLGTGKVTAFSTSLTAIALLGLSFAPSFSFFILLAIPLGLGAGAIDAALNNYVALHYSATQMSFLHCFYGVGVTVSPFLLSFVMDGPLGWRGGYGIASCIQLSFSLLFLLTLPLWHRVGHKNISETPVKTESLSFWAALKIPGVKTMCALFFISCAMEFTCGNWGASFLVDYHHMTAADASGLFAFYYVGITLGRFLSGVLASRWSPWKIITLGQVVLGGAIVILLLPVSGILPGVGLFLVGLGNGPLYPNFTYLAPITFGKEKSQGVIGAQMVFANLGVMLAPIPCGILGETFSMGVFPFYLAVFFLLMIVATIHIKKQVARYKQS